MTLTVSSDAFACAATYPSGKTYTLISGQSRPRFSFPRARQVRNAGHRDALRDMKAGLALYQQR